MMTATTMMMRRVTAPRMDEDEWEEGRGREKGKRWSANDYTRTVITRLMLRGSVQRGFFLFSAANSPSSPFVSLIAVTTTHFFSSFPHAVPAAAPAADGWAHMQ